jgi:hypothetical protein
VHFDLLMQGQVYLSQHGVSGRAEQNPVLSRSEDSTDFSLGSLSATQATVEHTLTPARAE